MRLGTSILAGMGVFIFTSCSSNPRPKANTYLASEGRVNYVRNGFERVSFGMTESKVKDAVGHPFHVSAWRRSSKIIPGEKLGTKHTYWMKVAGYVAERDYDNDRWLDFFFDSEGKLVKIEGNLNGRHFTKNAQPQTETD